MQQELLKCPKSAIKKGETPQSRGLTVDNKSYYQPKYNHWVKCRFKGKVLAACRVQFKGKGWKEISEAVDGGFSKNKFLIRNTNWDRVSVNVYHIVTWIEWYYRDNHRKTEEKLTSAKWGR